MNKREAGLIKTKMDISIEAAQSALDAFTHDIETTRNMAKAESSELIADKLTEAHDALEEALAMLCERFNLDPIS